MEHSYSHIVACPGAPAMLFCMFGMLFGMLCCMFGIDGGFILPPMGMFGCMFGMLGCMFGIMLFGDCECDMFGGGVFGKPEPGREFMFAWACAIICAAGLLPGFPALLPPNGFVAPG